MIDGSIDFLISATLIAVAFVIVYSQMQKGKKKKPKVDKKKAKGEKELQKIKEAVKPQPLPEVAAPVVIGEASLAATQGDIKSLSEFPVGAKIGIEFTRQVEGTNLRITQRKGVAQIKVGRFGNDLRKFLFVVTPKAAYYVNPRKIIKVTFKARQGFKSVEVTAHKLVYDVLYAEPLNMNGSITYDDELESILTDSAIDQYVTIAAFEGAFQLTPTLKRVLLIIASLGFMSGLAINGSSHVVPTTIVHWIP